MQAATAGDERRNWTTAFMKHALPRFRKPQGNSGTTVQSCNTATATKIQSQYTHTQLFNGLFFQDNLGRPVPE